MSTLSKRDSQWDNISVFKKVLVIKPDDNGFYPIGFSYLLGAWDEAGIQYDYVDMFLYPGYDIESLIKRNDYLVVCTGGLLGSFTFFQTLFERVKNVAPNLPCVLGGNITMDFPTGLLFAHTNVDYLVFGEGEITGTLLLSHIQQKGIAPTDLLGVAYRSPAELEGFVRNKRRPPLDLTAHNWQPTWDFLEVDRYAQRPHCTLRLFPILTGRGCKGRCSFCSPTNGQYRGRPLNYVFQEIESILGKYDFDYLYFLTEVFFQEETEVLEFCRRYKELGVQKPWACLQRIDSSPHVLTAMKDAGCFTINVGVESGCNRILKEMKKDITVDQIRTFIDLMKACNMGIEASFMVGNYSETESDITKTVDMMLELGIGGPKAMCVNYPGTLNFTRAQNRGLIKDVLQYAKGLRRAYSFDWLQHIEAHKSGELAYLNVTDMSDDTLFEVVIRELRRLHEFGYHIKNVGATPIRMRALETLARLRPTRWRETVHFVWLLFHPRSISTTYTLLRTPAAPIARPSNKKLFLVRWTYRKSQRRSRNTLPNLKRLTGMHWLARTMPSASCCSAATAGSIFQRSSE
ncbi:MAG: radical SAM protein [Solidesulfovibrio sp.]